MKFSSIVVGLLGLAIPIAVFAQSVPLLPDAPSQAPIGGLGILVAAGVGYGVYKLKRRHTE